MKFPLSVYIQCLQLRTDTCVYLLSDNSTQSTGASNYVLHYSVDTVSRKNAWISL